jgi:hypothetical protein
MPPIVTSAEIGRPAAEVFACATDPARFKEWQKGVVEGHMEGPADGTSTPAVGAKCMTTRRIGGANRPSTSELTQIDPPRTWGVRGIDGPIRAAVDVLVEPMTGSRSPPSSPPPLATRRRQASLDHLRVSAVENICLAAPSLGGIETTLTAPRPRNPGQASPPAAPAGGALVLAWLRGLSDAPVLPCPPRSADGRRSGASPLLVVSYVRPAAGNLRGREGATRIADFARCATAKSSAAPQARYAASITSREHPRKARFPKPVSRTARSGFELVFSLKQTRETGCQSR